MMGQQISQVLKLIAKGVAAFLLGFALVAAFISCDSAESKANEVIVLNENNTLFLNQEINGESVSELITKANQLDKSLSFIKSIKPENNPIYLVLRTPGGQIQTGLELLEALKSLRRPVHTITIFSASMGFQLAQQLGTRYIIKDGVLMAHRAKGGFEGEFGGTPVSQIDNRKNFWERRLEEMDAYTVFRTKGRQTMESYQKAYASEMWVTGIQAIDLGYADNLVHIRCGASLSGVVTHHTEIFGITIFYDLDKCPLNSTPMNIRAGNINTNKGLMDYDLFLKSGGGFGTSCYIAYGKDNSVTCASDVNLNVDSLNKIKVDFVSSYVNIKERVLPLTLGK